MSTDSDAVRPKGRPVRTDAEPGGTAKTRLSPPLDLDLSGARLFGEFREKFSQMLSIIGAPRLVVWSARRNLARLCFDRDESRFMSKAKKFCESFMAVVCRTDHDEMRLTGSLRRWTDVRMKNPRSMRHKLDMVGLFQSLFKAKNLLGYATELMKVRSMVGHQKKLAESVADDTHVPEIFSALIPVLQTMMKGLRESFETPRMCASAKSTGGTDGPRSMQGKVGALIRKFHGWTLGDDWNVGPGTDIPSLALPLNHVDHCSAGLLPEDQRDPLDVKRARFDHLPPDDPDRYVDCEEPDVTWVAYWTSAGVPVVTGQTSRPRTENNWASFLGLAALQAVQDRSSIEVKITNICEAAGKIRTVSAGDSACATVVSVWQQACFDEMRNFPCFPSLSRTIDATDVMRIHHGVGEFMASSDFTSATDLLNPGLTNLILEFLVKGFPYSEVVMDDNADKVIIYPLAPLAWSAEYSGLVSNDGGDCFIPATEHNLRIARGIYGFMGCKGKKAILHGREVKIVWASVRGLKTCGQLMGQGTSFPLLCLVNLACSLAAFRRSGVSTSEALRRLIINGDDRLCWSTRRIEDDFWELASSVGLCRSPGKSHESPWYACINSQDYVHSAGIWRRAPVMRVGLFFGIKKLSTDRFVPSTVVGALSESIPRICGTRWIPEFLSRWGSQIRKEAKGRNLFLPVALGGFGQVAPPGWDVHYTGMQLALAERLMLARPFDDFSFGPKRDVVERPPVGLSDPWDQVQASPAWDVNPQDELDRMFANRIKHSHYLSSVVKRTLYCTRCRTVRSGGACSCGQQPPCRFARWLPAFLRCTCSLGWGNTPECDHPDHAGETFGCNCCGNLGRSWYFEEESQVKLAQSQILSAVRPELCLVPKRQTFAASPPEGFPSWQGQKLFASAQFAMDVWERQGEAQCFAVPAVPLLAY